MKIESITTRNDNKSVLVPDQTVGDAWRAPGARSLTVAEGAQSKKLFSLFLTHLRAHGLAETTVTRDGKHLDRMLRALGVPPWEWRACHIDAFLGHCAIDRSNSVATQLNYLYTARGFQNFLLGDVGLCNELERVYGKRPERYVTDVNSIAFKRKGRERTKIVTPLSLVQVDRLIAEFDFRIVCAKRAKSKSYLPLCRDKVMAQLSLLTGVRVNELIHIRLTHFLPDPAHPQFGAFAILRVIGKGSKERAIRLFNPAINDILTHYLEHIRPRFLREACPDPSLLFLSQREGKPMQTAQVRKRLRQIGRAAGLPMRVHPHLLRHTYATQMAPVIGPEALQRQLGHKYLSTTLAIYYHQDLESVGQEVLLGIQKMTAMLDVATKDL